jgi:NAD(P)-dependent dehydrogenase (short-subunit alcohol dehydrogenase family)
MKNGNGTFDLSELRGRIAVITGAGNHGIGWGIAKHAAGVLGMHIVVVDLHEQLVRKAAEELSALHPDVQVLGVRCDVTDPDNVADCLAAIQREMPDKLIGAVFANAGVIFNHTILRSTVEEWQTTLNVNVVGVINTIQAFVPVLQQQGSQAIFCNTASIGGLVRGDGGAAAYQASKHAVVALTEALSFELSNKSPHIRVHVLCPCIVQSGLHRTSQLNLSVKSGEIDETDVEAIELHTNEFAMTTERHAEQVFDHLAAGNFYMITDNVRPYVDHDFPFDGLAIVRERFENLLTLKIDNSDAGPQEGKGLRSSILKGPMFQEMRRRNQ